MRKSRAGIHTFLSLSDKGAFFGGGVRRGAEAGGRLSDWRHQTDRIADREIQQLLQVIVGHLAAILGLEHDRDLIIMRDLGAQCVELGALTHLVGKFHLMLDGLGLGERIVRDPDERIREQRVIVGLRDAESELCLRGGQVDLGRTLARASGIDRAGDAAAGVERLAGAEAQIPSVLLAEWEAFEETGQCAHRRAGVRRVTGERAILRLDGLGEVGAGADLREHGAQSHRLAGISRIESGLGH